MDLIENLLAIGFTEYEARVYLALLRFSPATGYQIAKEAGVPRSMVYESLGRLSTRGAVLKTEETRGTIYRPLPPQVLLDRYLSEQQQSVDRLRAGLETLYTAQEEEHIWSVSGRESALSYALKMLEQAQKEVLLVLSDTSLSALREGIAAAAARGVEISSLLTGEQELEIGRTARHARLESELQDLADFILLVADNREALVGREEQGGFSATLTRNRNIVMIARQFVWMELFTQRLYERLDPAMLERIDPADRKFFKSLAPGGTKRKGNY